MNIFTRSYGVTEFGLHWSHVNQCFVFCRRDCGANTETKLLTDTVESDAKKYFTDRVNFFCESLGIDESQLQKG